jgi:hypothetical protein
MKNTDDLTKGQDYHSTYRRMDLMIIHIFYTLAIPEIFSETKKS